MKKHLTARSTILSKIGIFGRVISGSWFSRLRATLTIPDHLPWSPSTLPKTRQIKPWCLSHALNVETYRLFLKLLIVSITSSYKMTSIPMDTPNGSSSRCPTHSKDPKLGSIFSICTSIQACIKVEWRLSFIRARSRKRRTWAGIAEGKISSISKMATLKAHRNINHFLHFLGSILFLIQMMMCTSPTTILSPTPI